MNKTYYYVFVIYFVNIFSMSIENTIVSITLPSTNIESYFKNVFTFKNVSESNFKDTFKKQYDAFVFSKFNLKGDISFRSQPVIYATDKEQYSKNIDTVLATSDSISRYCNNFTITGYVKSEHNLLIQGRENFMSRFIKYFGNSGSAVAPTPNFFLNMYGEDIDNEFKKKFLEYENKQYLRWNDELQTTGDLMYQTPIFSVTMPNLNHFVANASDIRSVGIVYGSGLNFETHTTSDYNFFNKVENKNKQLEAIDKVLYSRASLWIAAALKQIEKNREYDKSEKNYYIIIPRIGLGQFSKSYSSLQSGKDKTLTSCYYEAYKKVIHNQSQKLLNENIKIIFHDFNNTSNGEILEYGKDINTLLQTEIVYTYVEKESVYKTQWLDKLHLDITQTQQKNESAVSSYFSVIIHAGDNHSYFNNGCLADPSMEVTASQYDPNNQATNILPWAPNYLLGAFFHKEYGLYAQKQVTLQTLKDTVNTQQTIDNIKNKELISCLLEKINKVLQKNSLQKIDKYGLYRKQQEVCLQKLQKLQEQSNSIIESINELQINIKEKNETLEGTIHNIKNETLEQKKATLESVLAIITAMQTALTLRQSKLPQNSLDNSQGVIKTIQIKIENIQKQSEIGEEKIEKSDMQNIKEELEIVKKCIEQKNKDRLQKIELAEINIEQSSKTFEQEIDDLISQCQRNVDLLRRKWLNIQEKQLEIEAQEEKVVLQVREKALLTIRSPIEEYNKETQEKSVQKLIEELLVECKNLPETKKNLTMYKKHKNFKIHSKTDQK